MNNGQETSMTMANGTKIVASGPDTGAVPGKVRAPTPTIDKEKALAAFQGAARKVMRRMAQSETFRYVMMGTDTYGQILEAYALSLGKSLPELANMDPVAETWQRLHCQEG